MFADFRKGTSGTGTSFKGALAYFLNDKGEGPERPNTDERVDVLELRNLVTDDARHAWFEMMNTAEASEALKAAAGIPKGGRRGTKPVFTYYLSWHDSQQPDRAEMLDAARSSLRKLGLVNHQALIVSHVDTDSPHVHIIVNRVDPQTGRYAGLSNSWKALKEWAIDYSKEHGTHWHIPLEQAKQARQQQRQTGRQASFNAGAMATPAPAQIPASTAPRARSTGRAEWQARKTAGNDNRAGEAAAAAVIKKILDGKWVALRQAEQKGFDQRLAETARYREDRQAQRSAIYAKFDEAYHAIWKPEPRIHAPRPTRPDNATLLRLIKNHRSFIRNEGHLLGRLLNARRLAKGESMWMIARLAMNGSERMRRFERMQRRITSEGRWGKTIPQNVRLASPPEPKKVKAERLKVMRTQELAAFDRETQQGRRGLAASHDEQIANLRAAKAALSAEGKAAWASHAATYRGPAATKQQDQAGRVETTPARAQDRTEGVQEPRQGQEATADRFGRSRDRKPRQPRAERQGRADQAGPAASPENAQQQGRDHATADPSDQAARPQPKHEKFTPEESRRAEEIKARWRAEREASERGEDRGLDRGR